MIQTPKTTRKPQMTYLVPGRLYEDDGLNAGTVGGVVQDVFGLFHVVAENNRHSSLNGVSGDNEMSRSNHTIVNKYVLSTNIKYITNIKDLAWFRI